MVFHRMSVLSAIITTGLFVGLVVADPASGAELMDLASRPARSSPQWVTRGVIYQIQPRAFTPEGTLKAATERLPRLAELGVGILYLCPVFVADDDPHRKGWSPRQRASGMNNPRNPYRMKDYDHVDPEYGTDADLKAFVAAAHRLGMHVLLDMVYLHCGPNAVFLKEHPDFVERDTEGKIITQSWGFPAIDFSNPKLREYFWKNMEYWVREFDVDGQRVLAADTRESFDHGGDVLAVKSRVADDGLVLAEQRLKLETVVARCVEKSTSTD